jgi:ferredoxin
MRYLAGVATLSMKENLCTGCGMCSLVCPHGVLTMRDGRARIMDRDGCMECGACARNCPSGAVTVKAGVGCAVAVIGSALGLSNPCCSLDDHGVPDINCGSSEKKPPRMGCC